MKTTVTLTVDEALQCRYALSELANRRQEQFVETGSVHAVTEAECLRALAKRITESFVQPSEPD